jgi:hypothetical protein
MEREMKKNGATQRREKIRKEFWPDADAWTGEKDTGWFRAPRTLPLILTLLASKEFSERYDPTTVYLELMARHIDSGIIEMVSEEDHAFAAGYSGSRAVRSWRERMKILEDNGFIKVQQTGNQRYKYVLLVHPTVAIQRLRNEGKIPDHWWNTYRSRQIEVKESSFEEREAEKHGKLIALPIKQADPSEQQKVG